MTRIAEQVSRVIRILRGNRDESARASHLVVSKKRFVFDEAPTVSQAEREKFFQSTLFERKSMSTKTAFKRIALVAAAALAIGGISAVSANATATGPDWTITNAQSVGTNTTPNETATQVAGPGNFVTLTNSSGSAVYYTVSGGTTTSGTTSGTADTATAVNIATPTVGTITVTGYDIAGGAASTTATSTTTISVISAAAGTVYASTAVLGAALSATPTSTTDATFPITEPASMTGSPAANFTLQENDANGVALTSGFKPLAISSTLGVLAVGGSFGTVTAAGGYASGTPTGPMTFTLTSDGRVGTATVAVSVNGVAVKSYSVTFTGAPAKIVLTDINPVVAVGTAPISNITANTNAFEVQEFDAAGNLVSLNSGITLTSANSAIATADSPATSGGFLGGGSSGTALSSTVGGVSVNGVAAGTTTFTATDGTLVSAPVTVRVATATPTTVTITTDAATYPAGGVGTLTITLSDAGGPVAAGTYTVLTAGLTSSLALAAVNPALPTGTTITVGDAGTETFAFNAPLSSGTDTITGTGASGVTVVPASFDITSSSSDAIQAAVDAANEATDAANAATDAANAAADSADAATQAAQDAGDKADAALAAVTALSQLVTYEATKIRAIVLAVAKIYKALAKLRK